MRASGIVRVSMYLGALALLSNCSSGSGTGGTGGASSSTGGSSATGGSGNGTGGSSNSTGGSTGTGGSSSGTGGSVSTGGSTGTGGSHTGGSNGTGGSNSTGGSNGTGGANSTGGSNGTGGSSSGTGGTPGVDQGGQALAKKGDSTSTSKAYLNLGDMRLLNNRWGSDSLIMMGHSCSSNQSVFVNSDGTLGWSFNRGSCGESMHSDPDFPEVEFGVAPFGTQSSNLTSPPFSSTTLLPIQLSSLTSASVTMDTFSTTFSSPTYWDANFEFWISKNDPTKNADGGVYAEIITFVGWNTQRQDPTNGWSCQITNKTVPNTNFSLCHQNDSWANGQWRFFNFIAGSGTSNYSGKVDIKAILDFVRSNYSGFTDSMYLTRIEIGTEIDDSTAGSAKVGSGLTFEINGTSKKIQLGN